MSRNTFIQPHDWEPSLFMSWLGSFWGHLVEKSCRRQITAAFRCKCFFFVSACHSSTVKGYNNLVSTKKSSLGYVFIATGRICWYSTSRFQSTLRFEMPTPQKSHLTLSQKMPDFQSLYLIVNLNISSQLGHHYLQLLMQHYRKISRADLRGHSPDTGL